MQNLRSCLVITLIAASLTCFPAHSAAQEAPAKPAPAPAPAVTDAADWLIVEDSATNKIYWQKSSLQNAGAATTFVYRIDFTDMQTNTKTGKEYRSVVVKAAFHCLTGQMVRSEINAYAETGGAGESRGNSVPTGDQARPFGIVRGSSDDRLRRAVCTAKASAKP